MECLRNAIFPHRNSFLNSVQNRREKTKSNLQGSKLLSNMFLQRKMIAVKYDDALDTLPSRATLCYESFEISLIRSFTSASFMPVAMAII